MNSLDERSQDEFSLVDALMGNLEPSSCFVLALRTIENDVVVEEQVEVDDARSVTKSREIAS